MSPFCASGAGLFFRVIAREERPKQPTKGSSFTPQHKSKHQEVPFVMDNYVLRSLCNASPKGEQFAVHRRGQKGGEDGSE